MGASLSGHFYTFVKSVFSAFLAAPLHRPSMQTEHDQQSHFLLPAFSAPARTWQKIHSDPREAQNLSSEYVAVGS